MVYYKDVMKELISFQTLLLQFVERWLGNNKCTCLNKVYNPASAEAVKFTLNQLVHETTHLLIALPALNQEGYTPADYKKNNIGQYRKLINSRIEFIRHKVVSKQNISAKEFRKTFTQLDSDYCSFNLDFSFYLAEHYPTINEFDEVEQPMECDVDDDDDEV